MKFDPEKHHRRSIRLTDYDYSQSGAYFITICTKNRDCLLGEIVDSEMVLNGAGMMMQTIWEGIPDHYPGVQIDEFVIMPNHAHGIIILTDDPVGAGLSACPQNTGLRACPKETERHGCHDQKGQPQGFAPTNRTSLPDVVHRFKSLTTARYRHGVTQNGWQPFRGKLWQCNYYEHVVRDEESLDGIQKHIAENPFCWETD